MLLKKNCTIIRYIVFLLPKKLIKVIFGYAKEDHKINYQDYFVNWVGFLFIGPFFFLFSFVKDIRIFIMYAFHSVYPKDSMGCKLRSSGIPSKIGTRQIIRVVKLGFSRAPRDRGVPILGFQGLGSMSKKKKKKTSKKKCTSIDCVVSSMFMLCNFMVK